MHEYSVVASLLDLCLEQLESNNAKAISHIVVSVGERANIDKTLLVSAFDVLKVEYKEICNAKIAIITEKLMLECRTCGGDFHSLDNPVCPFCDSRDTFISQGRDIRLEKLELEI